MRAIVLFLSVYVLLFPAVINAQVSIGSTTPHSSAQLDIVSTSKGVLFPRMTAIQRADIHQPETGLFVFQTDGTPGLYYFDGAHWRNLTTGYMPNANGFATRPLTGALVSSFVGSGAFASIDATGTAAAFRNVLGIVTNAQGDFYVGEQHAIRKMTAGGEVTTFAGNSSSGSANGSGTAASFNYPSGMAVDNAGNLFVADVNNHLIRKITPDGIVTTFAGSGASGGTDATGTAASFTYPRDIAIDQNDYLYVVENHRVRVITPSAVVTTLAGSAATGYLDATGTAALFNSPQGIVIDASGNLFVADMTRIRKITPWAEVTTVAGNGNPVATDGTGTAASFQYPRGIAIDGLGNLYVTEQSHTIRKITPAAVVTTIAGSGASGSMNGLGTASSFSYPDAIEVGINGNLYVSEQIKNWIRKIEMLVDGPVSGAVVSSFAGSGEFVSIDATGTAAAFRGLLGIVTNAQGDFYVGEQHAIRKMTAGGEVTTFAGNPNSNSGFADGTGTAAQFNYPSGMAVDNAGNLFVADVNNHRIRKITPEGVVTTFAGSGASGGTDATGTAASFHFPRDIAIDQNDYLYVVERHRVRMITPSAQVTTLAGSATSGHIDGTGTAAGFTSPHGIVIDATGNLFVSDGTRIRKITPSAEVTTFAGNGNPVATDGTGTAASFMHLMGIAIDGLGNLYVTEQSHTIRKITPAAVVTTIAGSGASGSVNGIGTASSFSYPGAITVGRDGNLFVGEEIKNRIRKIVFDY